MFVPANLVSVVFNCLQPDKYKQHVIFFFNVIAVQAPVMSVAYKAAFRSC